MWLGWRITQGIYGVSARWRKRSGTSRTRCIRGSVSQRSAAIPAHRRGRMGACVSDGNSMHPETGGRGVGRGAPRGEAERRTASRPRSVPCRGEKAAPEPIGRRSDAGPGVTRIGLDRDGGSGAHGQAAGKAGSHQAFSGRMGRSRMRRRGPAARRPGHSHPPRHVGENPAWHRTCRTALARAGVARVACRERSASTSRDTRWSRIQ